MVMKLEWSRSAACLDLDPELFFPISLQGAGQSQVERAKAVCRGCPVRRPCLDYAISSGQTHGVWGGTDPEQRRTLIPRAMPPPGTAPARSLRGGR
ncbi:WhiB family transcriptional regulator [Nonomuraea sp. NPDC049714]|jgi:WhiB family redox-sensing transcriptional regulator|uniref:WhiB family transcriptional regulator n=2 Tax=unclassified Nonomuraea TaxID=2593643 RepID=UPI0037B1AFB4